MSVFRSFFVLLLFIGCNLWFSPFSKCEPTRCAFLFAVPNALRSNDLPNSKCFYFSSAPLLLITSFFLRIRCYCNNISYTNTHHSFAIEFFVYILCVKSVFVVASVGLFSFAYSIHLFSHTILVGPCIVGVYFSFYLSVGSIF